MRTRIKEFRKKDGKVSCYAVQELCNDGVFRTIDGGVCDTKEQAETVRKSYKAVGKFVRQFNEKYHGERYPALPEVPTMRLSEER